MAGEVRVGTSGWSYDDWTDIVYPRRGKPDTLRFMAEYFDALEINSSFYRPPTPQTTAGWVRRVADRPDFTFTAKLFQRFTHQRDKPWTPEEVDRVTVGLDPLAEADRLGAVLVQFPWSFRNERESRDWLSALAEAFAAYPLAVEVRHDSWLDDEGLGLLTQLGASLCSIDQPDHRNGIRPGWVQTGPVGYVRLHGRNRDAWFTSADKPAERYNYLYDERELDEWVRRIRRIQQGSDRTYVFTNNHYRGQAPANALELRSRLEDRRVTVPDSLMATYPRLANISTVPPGPRQQRIF